MIPVKDMVILILLAYSRRVPFQGGRQRIKVFRIKNSSAGTFPVAIKKEGVYCRNDQVPNRVES